ncbi:hypothetical protein PRZ48_015038 [Zasmidium cellare]|uniref:Uncharacterized protein n=1 Tax=Zasmidium cellare TaxID=395010 RepID=A0ABR0DXZ8_ZASCE|nr:hypothetical protein PRZ48_015038 [Zasmidium cellare]
MNSRSMLSRSLALCCAVTKTKGTPMKPRICFEAADTLLEQSNGFRWWSSKLIESQDRTLKEYRAITALNLQWKGCGQGLQLGDDVPEDANDHLLFPVEPDQVTDYVRLYLAIAATKIQTRRLDKDKIRAATILRRREHMWYWIAKGRKAAQIPRKVDLYTRTSETIQWIGKTQGFAHDEKRRITIARYSLISGAHGALHSALFLICAHNRSEALASVGDLLRCG